VEDGTLRFHDLAVDLGLAKARAYEVEVEWTRRNDNGSRNVRLAEPALPLQPYGDATRLSLEFEVRGDAAKSTKVELLRTDTGWTVTRVRHG
jgi:hypothetical protein